jgi:benzoylformate decarboxylase
VASSYSITGLWTAAQHHVHRTFLIIRDGVYEALKDYGDFLVGQLAIEQQ